MDYTNTWAYSFTNAFNDAFTKISFFLPNVIVAILIFLIGWIVAEAAGKTVKMVLKRSSVDSVSEIIGLTKIFKEAGFELSISNIGGWVVKWFIVWIFLIAVSDVLRLSQVSNFIDQVTSYIPNVIAAVLILIIGIVAANIVFQIVSKAASATEFASSRVVATVAKWAIIIFTLMAALTQLNIAREMIQILFQGIVAASALALGLAFGLGGKEQAQKILEKISRHREK